MAKGSETLRKGAAVSAGSFASPQLLHASSRTRKAHGFSALAAQTHDLDLPPGCNPTAPRHQHHMVTSLVPGEIAEPQDVPPNPDTPSLCYSKAIQTLQKGVCRCS